MNNDVRDWYNAKNPPSPYSFWRSWVAPHAHQQHCFKYAEKNKGIVNLSITAGVRHEFGGLRIARGSGK